MLVVSWRSILLPRGFLHLVDGRGRGQEGVQNEIYPRHHFQNVVIPTLEYPGNPAPNLVAPHLVLPRDVADAGAVAALRSGVVEDIVDLVSAAQVMLIPIVGERVLSSERQISCLVAGRLMVF